MSSAIKDPARVYVIWHPNSPDAPALAHSVFQWFQQVPGGAGIPVSYRCDPDPVCEERRQKGLPLEIDFEKATLNLLVLLVDEHLVVDERWTEWLDSLASGEGAGGAETRMYPVALHPSAFNLPPSIRRLNFITLQESTGRGTELRVAPAELRARSLRKKLTEAFARVLLVKDTPDQAIDAPPPVKVFLSHAKADGRDQSASIRDYIYSETQLTAFFDENDIALGQSFAEVLDGQIKYTGALLALNTDRYADRPWCRREVQEFRKPRKVEVPAESNCTLWRLNPVLVVDGLEESMTRCIPEFGNALCIRWGEGRQGLYIDALLREVMFREYHHNIGREIVRSRAEAGAVFSEAVVGMRSVVINWTPDLPTLQKLLQDSSQLDGGEFELIYPGHALSQLELAELRKVFPQIKKWTTFESTLWELAL